MVHPSLAEKQDCAGLQVVIVLLSHLNMAVTFCECDFFIFLNLPAFLAFRRVFCSTRNGTLKNGSQEGT